MKRLTIALRFMQNRRLEEYENIIRKARQSGYHITGVRDAYELIKTGNNSQPLLVLRHDVDRNSTGTLAMSDIERSLGAMSTFYFRWSTLDIDLIRVLNKHGHECSLHYETLPSYYIENKLNPATVRVQKEITNECRYILREEIANFEDKLAKHGIRIIVKSVAGHGHSMNKILRYVGRYLVLNAPQGFFGDIIDAYDPSFLGSFDIYISDTNLRKCNGYRYGVNPIQAMKEGQRNILFLSHPHHWHYTCIGRFREAGAALIRGVNEDVDQFDSSNKVPPKI